MTTMLVQTPVQVNAFSTRLALRPPRSSLRSALGEGRFATVLDCGLFHVFTDEDRRRYSASLRPVTGPGARLHLLCFSDQAPGSTGPRRIRAAEIVTAFAEDWNVEEVRRDTIDVTTGAQVPALLASLSRR